MSTDPRKAAYSRAWRERNKEHLAAYGRAYRERNRERIAATRRARYERIERPDNPRTTKRAYRAEDYPKLDPAFGHWLAGFIDGEGCFLIARRRVNQGDGYNMFFTLGLRADDLPVLQLIRERTGLGTLRHRPTRDARRAPTVVWVVAGCSGVSRLVDLLDRFPLLAKKTRDYAIWREAVLLWAPMTPGARRGQGGCYDWSAIEPLFHELRAVRVYQPATPQ